MNYELVTIGLCVWNLILQLRLNSKRKQTQRLMYSLDKIAHKKWRIVTTEGGFEVIDQEGDTAMTVKGGKRG